jgi:hypothetical protein
MTRLISRPARLAAAFAVPLLFAAATPIADGMTYEFVMKSQSTRTGNKEVVSMRGRGTYAGDEAKIEILDAASSAGGQEAFGGKGTYFVVKGAGREMYLVDPAQKQYMKWDIANLFAGMSKMMNAVGGMVKMQMSDIKIDAQDLGAGPSVQGYSTRHVRMTQNFTMTASMFGRSSKTRSETTTDYYFAPALHVANPFVTNSQQMAMIAQMDLFNNPDYKNQMTAANAKIPKTGVPLKTVTTMLSTDEKGKQETTVTTMEMVNFKASNIPSSAFAIPSDYKMIEMPAMNMAAGNGNGSGSGNGSAQSGPSLNADSVAAAAKAGAAEGAKQEVKDAAKDATVKKLRGIFKH